MKIENAGPHPHESAEVVFGCLAEAVRLVIARSLGVIRVPQMEFGQMP